MRRSVLLIDRSLLRTIFIICILWLVALATGPVIVGFHFGVRELVIFLVALLLAIMLLFPSQRVLQLGFVLWILTFGFGWRTLYITPILNIHPSEVAVDILFVSTLAMAIVNRKKIDFSIPVIIPLLMGFAVLGVITAIGRGTRIDVVLEEFKVFVVLVPSYYVVKWLVVTRRDWERAALLCIAVATYVSILGLLDYFAPGFSLALAGRISGSTVSFAESYGGTSFARAGFSFYGSYTAGFFIFTFFGLTIHHFLENLGRDRVKSILFALAVIVQIVAMYLSGYRGLWYTASVFLIAYAVVYRRAWVLVVGALISIPFLPIDFLDRFQSLINTQYADSSQYTRIFRAQDALSLMQGSPLTGVGWGGSGYVHSDLVQIGANLGVPALGVFLLWIGSLIWQLLRMARRSDWVGGYASVLFATICGLTVLLAGEGLIVFVQLTIPVWFVFAMVHRLVDLSASVEAESSI